MGSNVKNIYHNEKFNTADFTDIRIVNGGNTQRESVIVRHEPDAGRAGVAVGTAFVKKCSELASGLVQQADPSRHRPGTGILTF